MKIQIIILNYNRNLDRNQLKPYDPVEQIGNYLKNCSILMQVK
jgi:hypothetical protein